MIDRRTVLAGLSTLAIAPRAFATSHTYTAGALTVRILSDGHMMVPLDRLATASDPAALQAALGGVTQPRFAVNVTLIEYDGRRILIDAGAGGTWVETAGKLGDALPSSGIDPATIDHVVFTHAHPDHLWGAIDDFDNTLRFPKATYSIPNVEFDFWMSPGRAEAAGAAEGVTAGARRVLKMVEPKLKRIAAEDSILPGLVYLDANGHTPGQCAVLASSGGEHVLIATDTLFHPIVSVRHPDWTPAQDMDGPAAVASRRKMLDIAASRQALVIAYHIEGAGRIAQGSNGYVWASA